jgi:hypothetical protein
VRHVDPAEAHSCCAADARLSSTAVVEAAVLEVVKDPLDAVLDAVTVTVDAEPVGRANPYAAAAPRITTSTTKA